MSIGRRKRFAVLDRDDFTCRYCGRRAPSVLLEVDHLLPRSHGGSDAPENLVTSCEDCNRGKSDLWSTREFVEIARRMDALEIEYLGAIRRIADLEMWIADRQGEDAVRAITWSAWNAGFNGDNE